jgi:hypothetical protein
LKRIGQGGRFDAELRGLLSSDSSKEDEEAQQKKEGWQELVEGAAPWNKDLTVDEFPEGSCDEEDEASEDDEEWTQ